MNPSSHFYFICVFISVLSVFTEASTYHKEKLLFDDSCTNDWQEKWMLDGLRSKVIHSPEGMELVAGPEHGNDACHTVLWTKDSFEGSICIEYDYTRTDEETRCVNILYFMATGKGDEAYPSDISLWNDKREVPRMKTYFNNMHTYHISYAAYPANYNTDNNNDYIRLRRYNPMQVGLGGTDVPGDHYHTGLFKPGVTYQIKVIRSGASIEMHISNPKNSEYNRVCKWDASMFQTCDEGRIGLRHMYTRSARYHNFKVWQISND